jgi:hypothetical protein
MKPLSLLLFTSLLIITGSCNRKNEQQIHFKQDVIQIVFFSNESDYSKEASYYDALIELKKKYPTEIKNMIVLSPDKGKPFSEAYDVETCPALLVIYNNKVIARIVGQSSIDEIINPVTDSLITALNKNNLRQKESSPSD